MSTSETISIFALTIHNYATGYNLIPIMYPEGSDTKDGVPAMDRLFENLDQDKDFLEKRRATALAMALAKRDRWEMLLENTSYPHQMAVSLLNALNSDTPSRCAIRIFDDWLGVELESITSDILQVLVDAMFGPYWRVLADVPCEEDWRVTFDAILRMRPAFAPGIVRGEPVSQT